MLQNYLKTALRNLLRQKGFSFLNITGLTIGLICCILIFQFVVFQTSVDKFHAKADRIYRVAITGLAEDKSSATARYGHGVRAFAEEAPGIIHFSRIFWDFFQEGPTISYQTPGKEQTFKESRALYVDPAFLQMFSFPLIKGDVRTALQQPGTLLLTEKTARRYFGNDDPIGKTLQYTSIKFARRTFTVAGVLKDIPPNSHLQFDMLLPMEDLLATYGPDRENVAWNPNDLFTAYAELRPDANPHAIEPMLTEVLYRNMGNLIHERHADAAIVLQPLSSVYFDRETITERIETGNKRNVTFYSIIAIIILVIAFVNYVNLTTAQSLERAKEVGMRKVVGAHRRQLIAQFLLESALINMSALVLALGFADMLTPIMNELTRTDLSGAIWVNPVFWALSTAIFCLMVLLSGLYPAFVLSSFRPIHALKGKATETTSKGTLRKGLVVLQFASSVALLICTGVVYSQLDYMRHLDTGLDLEQVLIVTSPSVVPEEFQGREGELTLKNEVSHLAAVHGASFTGNLPGRGFNFTMQALTDGAVPSQAREIHHTGIDYEFPDVYGLNLVAGEPFSEDTPSSYGLPRDVPRSVLINEAAVRALGFKDNATAVGQKLTADGITYIIHGVLSDFSWSSVHRPRQAVLFRHVLTNRFLSLKIDGADVAGTVAAVRKIYDKLFPHDVFQYEFADAAYDEQYRDDKRFATLFSIFAGLAIFIACLGLFGLASFSAIRRRKEIGIRKVLGATVAGIIGLLSRDFIRLILIAIIIATPIAWYAMSRWLENFASSIRMGPGVFALAGLTVIVVALATVSGQSLKAALENPVKGLRSE
jgi:putative ABC transport system permease protein